MEKLESTSFITPTQPVTFVFIDALHDYESVKADFAHIKPMLDDQAVVVFHDYSTWEGVHQAVDEAIATGDLEECSRADSLIVTRFNKKGVA